MYDELSNNYLGVKYDNVEKQYIYETHTDSLQRLKHIELYTGAKTITQNIVYDDRKVVNGNATFRILALHYDITSGYSIGYNYDSVGNIEYMIVYDESSMLYNSIYHYDSLNQLKREDTLSEYYNFSYTMVYSYDNHGNIQSKKEYSFQPDVEDINQLQGTPTETTYEYNSTVWNDQLTKYNDTSIQYDDSGNPIYIGPVDKDQFNFAELNSITSTTIELELHWDGRQLNGATVYGDHAAVSFDYYYNDQGIRTKKIIDGVKTEYYLNGDKVIYETNGTDEIYYTYDIDGTLISMNLNGTEYF